MLKLCENGSNIDYLYVTIRFWEKPRKPKFRLDLLASVRFQFLKTETEPKIGFHTSLIPSLSHYEHCPEDTTSHTGLTAIIPDASELASFPPNSPSPYIFLTPFHHVLRQENGWRWKKRSEGKVHSTSGNWCTDPEDRWRCLQSLLKTSIGTHPFFSHQQTPEERDVTLFLRLLWNFTIQEH